MRTGTHEPIPAVRQLALGVAPLHKVGDYFPSPEERRSHFQSEADESERVSRWGVGRVGFASRDSKDRSGGLSPPIGGTCHEVSPPLVFSALTRKPAEFVLQVFAREAAV